MNKQSTRDRETPSRVPAYVITLEVPEGEASKRDKKSVRKQCSNKTPQIWWLLTSRCEFTDSGLGRWEKESHAKAHSEIVATKRQRDSCEHQEREVTHYVQKDPQEGWWLTSTQKSWKPEAVIWHNWSPRRKVLSPKNSVPNKTILWSWRRYQDISG